MTRSGKKLQQFFAAWLHVLRIPGLDGPSNRANMGLFHHFISSIGTSAPLPEPHQGPSPPGAAVDPFAPIGNTRTPVRDQRPIDVFSEKGFYLSEFRGRTLAIAARAEDLARPEPLAELLGELRDNTTRCVLLSTADAPLARLTGEPGLLAGSERLEGSVWRAFAKRPHVGVRVEDGDAFAAACGATALRLGLSKLMWIDPGGGLRRSDGSRDSFVDLRDLRLILAEGAPAESPARRRLLGSIERALEAGLAAVNLSTLEGLADELFTYAGSGTLFTREGYMVVRRLGLDDYDAAHDLVGRGVAEGYLAERSPEEIEEVLASGFGAFVEGYHLAGVGALLEHGRSGVGEIACLYTLTRFLGEGVGGHLVRFALDRARERGLSHVFACTTSERVESFFARQGFRPVEPEALPAEKWQSYDPDRKRRVRCLQIQVE